MIFLEVFEKNPKTPTSGFIARSSFHPDFLMLFTIFIMFSLLDSLVTFLEKTSYVELFLAL